MVDSFEGIDRTLCFQRVLELLEHVVRRPRRITRPSEAVLFRKIDGEHPTILLDEIDTIFMQHRSA